MQLLLRPRRQLVAKGLQPEVAQNTEDADDNDGHEDLVNMQELLGPNDAEAEALVRSKQLRHDDQVPGRRQVDTRSIDDAGYGVRKDDLAKDRTAVGAESARHLDQLV